MSFRKRSRSKTVGVKKRKFGPKRFKSQAPRLRAAKMAALRTIANQRVAGFLGIETKFYDTALAPTALVAPTDASGAEFDPSATSMISTPAVGDSEQNRDGKRIMIKNVYVKGRVQVPKIETAVNPPEPAMVYVALVLDTQSNAAQMNSEDCFKNTSASAELAHLPMRNLLFGGRFRVLRDINLDITPLTSAGTVVNDFNSGATTKNFEWFVPLDLPVNFNAGTTASIANVIDNSLHIIAYVTSTVGAPTIAYNARIRFQG